MAEGYGKIATYADVFRGYIKPALLGGLVMRKKPTKVISGRKIKRMAMFRETMIGPEGCVVKSRGVPWAEFIRRLKECAAKLKTKTGPATIGRREYAKAFWKHMGKPEYIVTKASEY